MGDPIPTPPASTPCRLASSAECIRYRKSPGQFWYRSLHGVFCPVNVRHAFLGADPVTLPECCTPSYVLIYQRLRPGSETLSPSHARIFHFGEYRRTEQRCCLSPRDATAMTPLTPAEDKRRRNTAASARFRLKKKEREAALEKKSKELEMRVMELERECEGLRRENGWLKGLVVGVTGVGTAQQQQPQAAASAGVKRPREDVDVGSN
ncbi:hypothetical protein EI94DRAFT_1737615 [Lactarius quietus]|nr:hypothetical protein EI94DRAFT_1737615 [Lactarius quietus]